MARMFDTGWLMAAATAASLSGCASPEEPGADLQQKVASPTAACTGYLRAFGEFPSVATALTCSGVERSYVAYADRIAHRYSRCAFTFEPASGPQGTGTMTCSNDTTGPLTYDMADPNNIKVVATLNDGREMAFTLRDE